MQELLHMNNAVGWNKIMNNDLTVGKSEKVLWRFCLPLFGSIIFQQLYNIADSLVAGKFIGENALAAVGNSYEITLIFIAFAFGCNIGGSVVIAQFFGATSLGNKMPDKPYVYISQLRKYYNDLFVEGGVSSMLKANGAGTKVAAIQQTMRMMGFSSAEIADMVNMHEMDRKLTGILKQENALIDLRRSGGISVDQFTKRMNGLIRQANTLQTNYMKGSYYYRGVYPKRSGIPEKYRARLERENRLDAIRRANAIVDKESK